MTLLKNDDSLPGKPRNMAIVSWPTERLSNGLGFSVKDGWNVGIGFGLAMIVAIPLILILISCVAGIGLTILGTSLGSLLGG
jgi:hypothetical protein